MTTPTLEPAQHTAARIAGLLYLLTNATAMFAFWVRGQVIERGDATETAANILASERLYRIGIAVELLTVAGVIPLVVALYVVLRPVGRGLGLLATFWRLAENFVLAVAPMCPLAALVLLDDSPFLADIDPGQLQALAYALLRLHGSAFRIGFLFLGLGSTVFAVLWLRSRYVPRALAVLGIFASALLAAASAALLAFPGLLAGVGLAYMAPMGVFELGLGAWLLVRGIREPARPR